MSPTRVDAQGVLSDILSIADPRTLALAEAEHELLRLADFVYAHTALKPMSKTLFFLSRCLLASTAMDEEVAEDVPLAVHVHALTAAYTHARARLNGSAPDDDFSFPAVVHECREHLGRVLASVQRVQRLTAGTDLLGLAFNTLLRGKWEGGEGMGTFLTPEEVVRPMLKMALASLPANVLARVGTGSRPLLVGDLCGGTGRFLLEAVPALTTVSLTPRRIERALRLFDQSSLAVDFARLNFVFQGMHPAFRRVGDSLVDPVATQLRGQFALLATNPPFGAGKYVFTAALASVIPREVLLEAGMRGPGDHADPAFLFTFRNLDLLADGGVLAIVLPDGVLHSLGFRRALEAMEQATRSRFDVLASVSLPAAAFALGGTVARTSCVVIRRANAESAPEPPLFTATARHIGFRKRGNRRVVDPHGNDLPRIAAAYAAGTSAGDVPGSRSYACPGAPTTGEWLASWRSFPRLAPADLHRTVERAAEHGAAPSGVPLGEIATAFREYTDFASRTDRPVSAESPRSPAFHISVLDVDSTGLLDVVAALQNRPITRVLRCQPGDVLVSCLNPKNWRVVVVPDLPGVWTCSPEFVVLRAHESTLAWDLALQLSHRSVRDAVQAMAGGTSSSRQRVPKDRLLDVILPTIDVSRRDVRLHARQRLKHYVTRIAEARAYDALAEGATTFLLAESPAPRRSEDTH